MIMVVVVSFSWLSGYWLLLLLSIISQLIYNTYCSVLVLAAMCVSNPNNNPNPYSGLRPLYCRLMLHVTVTDLLLFAVCYCFIVI